MIGETVVYNIIGPGATVTTTVYDSPQKKDSVKPAFKIIVPMKLFFCEFWANALPICALSFNILNVEIKYRNFSDMLIYYDGADSSNLTTTPQIGNTTMWVEYVFVPNNTRSRFIDYRLQYSFCQIQDNGENGFPVNQINPRVILTQKLPICEIIYFVQEDAARAANHWEHYDVWTGNPDLFPIPQILESHIYISGSSRQDQRTWHYHARQLLYDRHTVVPQSRSINAFIWATYPEERYPMGTSNFTRIQQPELQIQLNSIDTTHPGKLYVFARNIQFFEINAGYSQLGFAL